MNKQYTKNLECVIKQILKPLKNIPFNLVVEAMCGKKVLPFSQRQKNHIEILNLLKLAAVDIGKKVNKKGILRSRPNEVGNDIENFVKPALNKLGLKADTPSGEGGNKKSTGYPDIIFWHNKEPYYLECKTYNLENINTTQRSFYFSPSDEFKVIYSTVHFLLSFEIYVAGRKKDNYIFKCKNYKILSVEDLSVDVKHEFNSDNKRMYSGNAGAVILAEGEIK